MKGLSNLIEQDSLVWRVHQEGEGRGIQRFTQDKCLKWTIIRYYLDSVMALYATPADSNTYYRTVYPPLECRATVRSDGGEVEQAPGALWALFPSLIEVTTWVF